MAEYRFYVVEYDTNMGCGIAFGPETKIPQLAPKHQICREGA